MQTWKSGVNESQVATPEWLANACSPRRKHLARRTHHWEGGANLKQGSRVKHGRQEETAPSRQAEAPRRCKVPGEAKSNSHHGTEDAGESRPRRHEESTERRTSCRIGNRQVCHWHHADGGWLGRPQVTGARPTVKTARARESCPQYPRGSRSGQLTQIKANRPDQMGLRPLP